MLQTCTVAAAMAAIMICAAPSLAFAQEPAADAGALAAPADAGPDATPSEPDIGEAAGIAYKAFTSKNWSHFAAALLIVVTLVLRRYTPQLPAFFKTDRGGVLLVFSLSLLGGLGHAVLAGASFTDFDLYGRTIQIALEAIGGYVGIRKLIWPNDKQPATT